MGVRSGLVLALFSISLAPAFPAGAEDPLAVKDAEQIEKDLIVRTRGFRPSGVDAPPTGRIDLRVVFEFNSSRLTSSATHQLDQLAIAIRSDSLTSSSFQLVGHTDAKGSAGYNKTLSIRRADAVRRYLIQQHGVSSARLIASGRGEDQLLVPGQPNDGRNRRVEVINLESGSSQ